MIAIVYDTKLGERFRADKLFATIDEARREVAWLCQFHWVLRCWIISPSS